MPQNPPVTAHLPPQPHHPEPRRLRSRFLWALVAVTLALGSAGCDAADSMISGGSGGSGSGSGGASEASGPEQIAVLTMQDGGEIRIRFFKDKAPNHVLNFKTLAIKGVYDGTHFHRVIDGFMIQGGDPNTKDDDPSNDGLGGPGYKIPAEFNDVRHVRGIVSMARAQHPDSAGSQFFIMVADRQPRPGGAPWADVLDGKYTAFGEVISGLEVADRIAKVPTQGRNNRPTEPQVIRKVEIYEVGPGGVAGSSGG